MTEEQRKARLKELVEKMRDGTATVYDDAEYKRLKFQELLGVGAKIMF